MNSKMLAVLVAAIIAIAAAAIFVSYHEENTQSDDNAPVTINGWTWELENSGGKLGVRTLHGTGTHLYAEDWPEGVAYGIFWMNDSYVPNLKYLEFPEGFEVLTETVLNNQNLETIVLPSTYIGSPHFYKASNLKTVITADAGYFRMADDGLLWYGENAVAWVEPSARSSVSFDLSDVTMIGTGAFQNCTGLESIEFPSTLTKIEAHAFKGCTNLEYAIVPENAVIDASAFPSSTQIIPKLDFSSYPTADMIIRQIANMQYEFSTTTAGKAIWNINEVTLEGSAVEYDFETAGDYKVTLTIYDENNQITHKTERVISVNSEMNDSGNGTQSWFAGAIVAAILALLFAAAYMLVNSLRNKIVLYLAFVCFILAAIFTVGGLL